MSRSLRAHRANGVMTWCGLRAGISLESDRIGTVMASNFKLPPNNVAPTLSYPLEHSTA